MNLMKQWVRMVNEGTYNFPEENPDSVKNDDSIRKGDKYEDLLKDIEKADKEYKKSKGTVSEAENDEDYPETTEDYPEETEEYKKSIEKAYDMSQEISKSEDPEYTEIHNRMTQIMTEDPNLENDETRNEYRRLLIKLAKLMKGDKDEESDKKYYVSGRIYIDKPQDTMSDTEDAFQVGKKYEKDENGENLDDVEDIGDYKERILTKLKGTVHEVNKSFLKEFETEQSAAKFVKDAISTLKNKYKLDYADFTRLEDMDVVDPRTGRKDNGIPKTIKQVDPNAFGFKYMTFQHSGEKKYGMGPKKDKYGEDTGYYDKTDKIIFIEFIVYKASQPIPYNGGIHKFFDGWAKANIEGYEQFKKDYEAEQTRKYKEALEQIKQGVEEFDEIQKREYVKDINNTIASMTANGEEDDADKILEPLFPNMTKEQRVNEIGPEELETLSHQQLYRLTRRIEGYRAKQYALQHPNEKGENILSDEEIKQLFDQELEGGSVDGYATRGDEKKSSKEDREDKEKEEKEQEREEELSKSADKIENDSDDVETSQDNAGRDSDNSFSQIRNMKDYKKDSSSSQKIHGVSITDKQLKYMQERIPRSEWPKNKEQAEKFVKRLKQEMSR